MRLDARVLRSLAVRSGRRSEGFDVSTLNRVGVAGLVVLVLSALPASAPAQSLSNDDCLACHADAGLVRADGRPVAVDPERFAASIHAGLECVTCHMDLADTVELPHAETLERVLCAMCHDEPATEYDLGIHAEARTGDPASPAASCVDCHGMHDIRPSADPASRTYHFTLPDTCGRCHGSADVIERGHIEIGDVSSLYADSIHGQALTRSGLLVAPNCADCHGAHDIRRMTNPESRIHRTNVPATCGRCHEGVLNEFADSVHGEALGGGDPTAPACHDCHSAHDIQRAETETWRLDVIRECGTCHTESIRTYRDTFHGQVTALGFTRVATCADCHTSHRIFPLTDARSSVGPAQLVATCQRCHEGANENFVEFDPHADKENRARNPFLYFTGKFMKNLLLFVFGFFGLHTALWFVGEVRERRRAGGRAKG